MCALKSLMSKVLSKTSVNVFRHQNVGGRFCWCGVFLSREFSRATLSVRHFKVALNFLHGAFLKPCKKVNLTF